MVSLTEASDDGLRPFCKYRVSHDYTHLYGTFLNTADTQYVCTYNYTACNKDTKRSLKPEILTLVQQLGRL